MFDVINEGIMSTVIPRFTVFCMWIQTVCRLALPIRRELYSKIYELVAGNREAICFDLFHLWPLKPN